MAEPLMSRLKRGDFIALAELQDRFVDMIFSLDKEFVLHGGTAIWRCYHGNRFSFDIDGYVISKKESEVLNNYLTWEIASRGMRLVKIRTIDGTMIITVSSEDVELKAELLYAKKKVRPVIKNYEMLNGSFLSIRTLSREDFIMEKIEAYEHRQYLRDLYDVYQLIDAAKIDARARHRIKTFISELEPPLKKSTLEEIVFSGAVPSFKDMVDHIKSVMDETHKRDTKEV